jgi:hypothetical protein
MRRLLPLLVVLALASVSAAFALTGFMANDWLTVSWAPHPDDGKGPVDTVIVTAWTGPIVLGEHRLPGAVTRDSFNWGPTSPGQVRGWAVRVQFKRKGQIGTQKDTTGSFTAVDYTPTRPSITTVEVR